MFQKEKEEGSKRKNIEITNIEKKKELKVEKRFCSIFFFSSEFWRKVRIFVLGFLLLKIPLLVYKRKCPLDAVFFPLLEPRQEAKTNIVYSLLFIREWEIITNATGEKCVHEHSYSCVFIALKGDILTFDLPYKLLYIVVVLNQMNLN